MARLSTGPRWFFEPLTPGCAGATLGFVIRPRCGRLNIEYKCTHLPENVTSSGEAFSNAEKPRSWQCPEQVTTLPRSIGSAKHLRSVRFASQFHALGWANDLTLPRGGWRTKRTPAPKKKCFYGLLPRTRFTRIGIVALLLAVSPVPSAAPRPPRWDHRRDRGDWWTPQRFLDDRYSIRQNRDCTWGQ